RITVHLCSARCLGLASSFLLRPQPPRSTLFPYTTLFRSEIYGYWGIVIASVLYVFPYAFLILSAALAVADARLYESAEMLGASKWRAFRSVTLPSTRYGLAAAIFVCFTLVITDFGNPMVIGGDYMVLASEVYNQVIGQANFEMGTVIGMVLLIPAAIAAIVEKRVSARQHAIINEHSKPL